MTKRKKHREFRAGDEVEVIESCDHGTFGYSAVVVDVRRETVIVESPFADCLLEFPKSQVVRA